MSMADQRDADFYSWAEEQAKRLCASPCDVGRLDLDHLAEEIDDIGRREIREISSLLHQTLAHLLKIAIAPEAPSANHWFEEIMTLQGDAVLAFSPGLKQRLYLDAIWRVACNGATRSLERYGVTVPVLPKSCPLALEDLLDPEFAPDMASEILKTAIQLTSTNAERIHDEEIR